MRMDLLQNVRREGIAHTAVKMARKMPKHLISVKNVMSHFTLNASNRSIPCEEDWLGQWSKKASYNACAMDVISIEQNALFSL